MKAIDLQNQKYTELMDVLDLVRDEVAIRCRLERASHPQDEQALRILADVLASWRHNMLDNVPTTMIDYKELKESL